MEIVLTLFFVLLGFLVCREIMCWYWKINEGVALLREIRDSLARLAPPVQANATQSAPAAPAPAPAE